MSLCACAAILALGVAVLLRGARNPMAPPLALLCIDMFVWNFADLAASMSGDLSWRWLDLAFSPFTPPLALHVVLVFVGCVRSLRWVLVGAYLAFASLSLTAVAAFMSPVAQRWAQAPAWRGLYLVLWAPLALLEVGLLIRHWRRSTSFEEQWRARLILASVVVGAALGSTEMWDDFFNVPALGNLGALGSMAIIAAVVLRFRLFGRDLSSSMMIYAVALAAAGTFGYLAIFEWLRPHAALLIVAAASLTLALAAAARDGIRSVLVRRERLHQLATLGRFAAQMAHDVRNPLAALKGALQLVVEEQARGNPADGQCLELALAQVDRIEAVMGKYQRLSAVQPVPSPLFVNDLVAAVLGQAWLAHENRKVGATVRIERALSPDLPGLRGDRDLLAAALENVVRNACEAMPQGGVLKVSTSFVATDLARGELLVRIEDQGVGMDVRQLERAFDDFFTTKAEGTGLGLGFVRRVVEAHGGEVRLQSQPSRGTVVEILLPVTRSAKEGAAA